MNITDLAKMNPLGKYFMPDKKQEKELEKQEDNRAGISEIDLEFMASYGNFNEVGAMSEMVNFTEAFQNKLARKIMYREMSFYPEICEVLDAICDDAVARDVENNVVLPNVHAEVPENIKQKMEDNFDYLVYHILKLQHTGWDMFRKWLIEDEQFIEWIQNGDGSDIIGYQILPSAITFPVYENARITSYLQANYSMSINGGAGGGGDGGYHSKVVGDLGNKKFQLNQVAYSNYGVYGRNAIDVLGYLETAVRSYNQLRGLEDSLVVYRMARAPARRLWNIEVGKMSSNRVGEYMNRVMQKYRRKSVYNPATGEIDSVRNVQSVVDDIWFPKRHGEGSSVEEFGGSMDIGTMDDVKYFLQKLYKSMRYPKTRWNTESSDPFSMSKPGEVPRDEIKWSRFINRLRAKWGNGIILHGWMQLNRMNITDKAIETWNTSQYLGIDFVEDNMFETQKRNELMEQRFTMLGNAANYMATTENPEGLFAPEYVLKEVFRMTDEEYKLNESMKAKMKASKPAPESSDEGGDMGGGDEEFGGE